MSDETPVFTLDSVGDAREPIIEGIQFDHANNMLHVAFVEPRFLGARAQKSESISVRAEDFPELISRLIIDARIIIDEGEISIRDNPRVP